MSEPSINDPLVRRLDALLARMTSLESRDRGDRWWDVALKFAVPLVIGAFGMSINHEIRISRIEENRFTNADGAALEARVLDKLPPQWLREQVNEIKAAQKVMLDRMRELELKVK